MKASFILLFSFLSIVGFAQDLKLSADDQFAAQNWAEASKSYKKHLKKNKNDSSAWYNLGVSQMQLKNYRASIESLKKASENNFAFNFVQFTLSKIYALAGQPEEMYTNLEKAAASGFVVYKRLTSDPEFSRFQSDQRFIKILDQIKLNAYPCLSAENYRHFDFWLGEWDVYVNEAWVGLNKITMAEGGCAIHENYTTAGNYAGQSINFYDPIDKKWHQHWVGSGGDVYNYLETNRERGMLEFESKFMTAQGQITQSRLTFTLNDDGTVRQLFESSTDEGKTWTSSFDGLYKRRD